MKLADLAICPYVPEWPAYRAELLANAVIMIGSTPVDLAAADMVAYRLLTFVEGRKLAIILPVPVELEDPLANPWVVGEIAQAVRLR